MKCEEEIYEEPINILSIKGAKNRLLKMNLLYRDKYLSHLRNRHEELKILNTYLRIKVEALIND